MKELLFNHLRKFYKDDFTAWHYYDDVNEDALTEAWLDKGTSYIYKVSVALAVDANKCDWVYLAIGMQRTDKSEPIILGSLHFKEGENDDMGRTIQRALGLCQLAHSAFSF